MVQIASFFDGGFFASIAFGITVAFVIVLISIYLNGRRRTFGSKIVQFLLGFTVFYVGTMMHQAFSEISKDRYDSLLVVTDPAKERYFKFHRISDKFKLYLESYYADKKIVGWEFNNLMTVYANDWSAAEAADVEAINQSKEK